jgi:hypothetical protein
MKVEHTRKNNTYIKIYTEATESNTKNRSKQITRKGNFPPHIGTTAPVGLGLPP